MSATAVERAPRSGATEDPALKSPAPANGCAANQKRPAQADWRPSLCNRTIFERRALGGEPLAALALEYKVSHQRIAQIALRVEGWIVAHPEDRLAQRMRLRCRLRYEAVYDAAMTGFAASRREEVTLKERKTRRPAPASEANAGETKEIVTTVEESIVRQRHGDPRLLATALKAVEKLERLAATVGEDQSPAPNETRPADREAENRETGNGGAGNRETVDRESDDQEAAADAAEPAGMAVAPADASHALTDAPAENDPHQPESRQPISHTLESRTESGEAASSATARTPASDDGDGTPRRIALRPRGPVVLMANGGHVEHMRSVAERTLVKNAIIALRGEKEARGWLARPQCEAALIWLEDNLLGRPAGAQSCVELARTLAARGADCPVVVGQGERDGESATVEALREAGLKVDVVRLGGGGWIRRDWLPVVERLVA